MGKLELLDRVTYCFDGATYYGVVVGRHDFAERLHLPTAYKVAFGEPVPFSGGERTVYVLESKLKKRRGKRNS